MKQLFLSVALTILTLITFAHTPTQQCSAAGWFTYIWSDLGYATSVRITWGHGQHLVRNGNGYDTTIYNLNLKPITNFQAPDGQEVLFQFSDGYVTTIKVKTPPCGNLPALFSNFGVKKIETGLYSVFWTTEIESNVAYFTIQAADSGDWHIVAQVKSFYPSGNGSIPHDYKVLIDANQSNIVEAGFGKNGYWILVVLLSLTSCSKESIIKPNLKGFKYVRITEVDKDGNSMNLPVMATF
jgi:hypothetical protein